MDVMDAIRQRRSIRKYSERPVEDDKLNKVLEAARLAPSASNRQNWKFIVVRDGDKKARLAAATNNYDFIGQAPIIIAFCGTDPDGMMRCGQYRHSVDLSIAASFLILEAEEQGLGTCWIGGFDDKKVMETLDIPDNVRVVALTPLGYAAESPDMRPRKRLEEVVCYEKYE